MVEQLGKHRGYAFAPHVDKSGGEGKITDMQRLVILGISALYAGTQNPIIQEFVLKARTSLGNVELIITGDEKIDPDTLTHHMLRSLGEDSRQETHLRALQHAKGVLVGQKKSSERNESLRIVSQRLFELNQSPVE